MGGGGGSSARASARTVAARTSAVQAWLAWRAGGVGRVWPSYQSACELRGYISLQRVTELVYTAEFDCRLTSAGGMTEIEMRWRLARPGARRCRGPHLARRAAPGGGGTGGGGTGGGVGCGARERGRREGEGRSRGCSQPRRFAQAWRAGARQRQACLACLARRRREEGAGVGLGRGRGGAVSARWLPRTVHAGRRAEGGGTA